MKKLLLISLMMFAGSAWAKWVMYSETDANTFYYDPSTIRKDGHIRRVWQIRDFKSKTADGEMSSRSRLEFDCKQERMKILGITTHSEPMADGKTLYSEGEDKGWRVVPPETPIERMFNIVCAK